MSEEAAKETILVRKPNEQGYVHPNSSPNLIYANGFIGGNTTSDFYLIGTLNGMPNFTLNMSFTTAKQLQIQMNSLIKKYEELTKSTIPTAEEIAEKLNLIKREK